MKWSLCFLVTMCVFGMANTGTAESVTLDNGSVLEYATVTIQGDMASVHYNGVRITIPKSRIVDVKPDPTPEPTPEPTPTPKPIPEPTPPVLRGVNERVTSTSTPDSEDHLDVENYDAVRRYLMRYQKVIEADETNKRDGYDKNFLEVFYHIQDIWRDSMDGKPYVLEQLDKVKNNEPFWTYIKSRDDELFVSLRRIVERATERAEFKESQRRSAQVIGAQLRREMEERRRYEAAFQQFVQERFRQENGFGPLPPKDWFGDDGTTRMLKDYIETLLDAGAPPQAFDDQMASIIRGDAYLSAKYEQSQIYKRYMSPQNLARLRTEFNNYQRLRTEFNNYLDQMLRTEFNNYQTGYASDYQNDTLWMPNTEQFEPETPFEGFAPDAFDMNTPMHHNAERYTQSNDADRERRMRILNTRIASIEREIDGINGQIDLQQKEIDRQNDFIQRIKDKEGWQDSHDARERINQHQSVIYRSQELQKELRRTLTSKRNELRGLEREARSL